MKKKKRSLYNYYSSLKHGSEKQYQRSLKQELASYYDYEMKPKRQIKTKQWEEYTPATQKKYLQRIEKNIRDLRSLRGKVYESEQEYQSITEADISALFSNEVNPAMKNMIMEQLRKYTSPNALAKRLGQQVARWQYINDYDISLFTVEETRRFYLSKYFVMENVGYYESDAVISYMIENGEDIQFTRLKEFIKKELIPEYQMTGKIEDIERLEYIVQINKAISDKKVQEYT